MYNCYNSGGVILKEKVYVFGHRNPDTDAVTAAITLAYLRKQLGMNAIPAVLSGINLETRYALNYFKVKEPIFLNDVRLKVKDLNYTKKCSVIPLESINDAYLKMTEAGVSKIPVVDNNKKLLGIVSMKDIAREQFSLNIENVCSTYNNIIKVIDGVELLKYDDGIKGKLVVAGYHSARFLNTVKLNNSNIMITSSDDLIEYAVKSGVKLLIITGNHKINGDYLKLAKKNKVNIISTVYSTLITSRKINLANNIETIDYIKDIVCVSEYDNVSDFVRVANKTRYSYYPVLNVKDECIGILRVSDVNYENKKKVILVDHNSFDQSAVGIEEADILEIVDHHNLGSLVTNMPVNFRNVPVGSSNTIIYIMYQENQIEIPRKIAGLMLSGILSDTLILTSPTTTSYDKKVVKNLAKIVGIDYKQYGLNMLKAGSSIKGKTKEEVLYTDYKNYPVLDKRIGLGQIFTTNPLEVLNDKDSYVDLLNRISDGNDNYFIALFITDILNSGSYVLYSDRARDILRGAFKNSELGQGDFLKGIVSRKKQILPSILFEMGEE